MAAQKASISKKKGRSTIKQSSRKIRQRGKVNQLVNIKVSQPKSSKQPQVIYGPGGAGGGGSSSSSSSSSGGGFGGGFGPGGGGYPYPYPVQQQPVVTQLPQQQPMRLPQPPSPYLTRDDSAADTGSFFHDNPMRGRRAGPAAPVDDMSIQTPRSPSVIDLNDMYPEEQRPSVPPPVALPRERTEFRGFPGIGPHGGDDDFGSGPPPPESGAGAILAMQQESFMSDASQAFALQRKELEEFMRRTEEARIQNEVQHRMFMEDRARFDSESQATQAQALRRDMDRQLREFASQAKSLFSTLETELQQRLQLTSDARLEQEKEALRRQYNALLSEADRYRRDNPGDDGGSAGSTAILAQLQEANAGLEALESRLNGVMSREEALAALKSERDQLQANVAAVRTELRMSQEAREQQVESLQGDILGLRRALQTQGDRIPADLASTLTRLSVDARNIKADVGKLQTLKSDVQQVQEALTRVPQEANAVVQAAVSQLNGSLRSIQRDVDQRMASQEERIGTVISDQVNARRFGEGMQSDLTRLRAELADQSDQQARDLATRVEELQGALRNTNASGQALQTQVAGIQEELSTFARQGDVSDNLTQLAEAVESDLANVQRDLTNEQDRRIARQLVSYRAAVDVLSRGARQQSRVTQQILQGLQAQSEAREVQSYDSQNQSDLMEIQSQMMQDAGRGMMALGGSGGRIGELVQAGQAQGLMSLAQQGGGSEDEPRQSTAIQDFVNILSAAPPPAPPSVQIRHTPPVVMNEGFSVYEAETAMRGLLSMQDIDELGDFGFYGGEPNTLAMG